MDLHNWQARAVIDNRSEAGRFVSLAPFDATVHGPQLWAAFGYEQTNDLIHYYGWPALQSAEELGDKISTLNQTGGFATCVFIANDTGKAVGMASYMRTDPANGVTEVGCVAHGAAMARTPLATDAHYMMARRAFDTLGYRRYEWKLNNLNQPSHAAAQRYGFTFEGVFRNMQVIRGNQNRDTAWYSMIIEDWPMIKAAFEVWLDPANFDGQGQQKHTLQQIRAKLSG